MSGSAMNHRYDKIWDCLDYLRNIRTQLKVCKSVHHHTIQINQRTRCKISPVYYLTFIYSSTCFGLPHTHHQELSNCSSSLWFYLRGVVIAVLLVVFGPVGPTTDQQQCYHHAPTVKPEAATAVVELLMMGVRTPKTC